MVDARERGTNPSGGEVRIGCSGWQYRHWRGAFYPASLPQSRWFAFYAERFDTVEINNTFYRLPERPTFLRWRRAAPERFLYALKASRFLTHMKKLKDPEEPTSRLFSRARALGPTLGPTLYQLPPNWKIDPQRLDKFLQQLPRRYRHAIEFRDPTWYTDEVLATLRRHRVALCLHDMAGSATTVPVATAPFVYVRFHGPVRYSGRYTDSVLDTWAVWLAGQVRAGRDVFAYFNNDAHGDAPRDAVRLREALWSYLEPRRGLPDHQRRGRPAHGASTVAR